MVMIINRKLKCVLFMTVLFMSMKCFGQGNNNIEIRFLRSKFIDTVGGKDLVAIFLVSTKDSVSFPPIVKLPPKCTVFEDGREKVVIFTQNDLAVTLDGAQIREKNPATYEFIKDVIDLNN